MDHWFDDLTRRLAGQPLTRRSMISWTAKLSLAATGAGLLGRTPSVASAAGILAAPGTPSTPTTPPSLVTLAKPPVSTCSVDDSYGVLTTIVSTATPNGKVPLTLTHSFIAEVASGNAFSTLSVKAGADSVDDSGDDVILSITSLATARGVGRAHATYGPHYTGGALKRVEFSTDGRTIEGTVAGRPTEAAPIGTDYKTLKFKDGKPADPDTQASPELKQAINDLFQQARGQLPSCAPDKQASRVVAACTSCQLSCRESWITCSVVSAHSSLACGSFAPSCYLGTATSNCDALLQRCFQRCKSSGACCPDYCKSDAACCQSSWGCCAPSSPTVERRGRLIPGRKGGTPASTITLPPVTKAWPTCPRCGPPTDAVTTTPGRQQG